MTVRYRARRSAVVAALAVATLALAATLLAGCSAGGPIPLDIRAPQHSPAKTAAKSRQDFGEPAAKSCWKATYDGFVQYADWVVAKNGGPVSCSQPHQLYTFAVLRLKLPHATEFTAQFRLVPAVADDAWDRCQDYLVSHRDSINHQNGRFQVKTFVPTPGDWAKGARWVRCDANIFKLGSPVADPQLEDLPSFATISYDLAGADFDFCTTVPGGTIADGPLAKGAVYASCNHDPQWLLYVVDPVRLADTGVDAPYPSAAQWASEFNLSCVKVRPPGRTPVPVYPTASEWANGTRTFGCWVGRT